VQIYNAQHYTTRITYNEQYYFYDGLGMAIPNIVIHLHKHLRQWYGVSPRPPALQNTTPLIITPYTPRQTDGWSCDMHMIPTSLSTIYHGYVLILQYSQQHVVQLTRMHLRYVLTREMAPWIDRLITYLSDPLQNEDPKPYSKHYNTGGTELVEHNLAQNLTNDKNHITSVP
jgi:hypothetical protein